MRDDDRVAVEVGVGTRDLVGSSASNMLIDMFRTRFVSFFACFDARFLMFFVIFCFAEFRAIFPFFAVVTVYWKRFRATAAFRIVDDLLLLFFLIFGFPQNTFEVGGEVEGEG